MADNTASLADEATPPRAPRSDGGRGGGGRGGGGGGRGGGERRQRYEKKDGEGDRAQGEGRGPRNKNRGPNKSRGNAVAGAPGTAPGAVPLTPADLEAKFKKTTMNVDKEAAAQRQESSGKGKEVEGRAPAADGSKPASGDEEEDADAGLFGLCDLCATPIEVLALSPCNHQMCHICALRMRALYKSRECPHCRTEAKYVIFTEDSDKSFQDYKNSDFALQDNNIGIKYCSQQIAANSTFYLHYNCPEPTCDTAARGWPDLHRHVRSVHHKKMCDLCSRNKKVFTHEFTLFTDKELQRHMSKGDDNPGAVDQSGFKGHPLCGFCGQRFYGDDELYVHCRDKHERCFLCDRQDSRNPHYYVDYKSLEQHFRKDHYMCLDRECQEKKFIVFDSEMDLKAHQLEEHGDSLSKDVRRDARVVDISSFDYRQPYAAERTGGQSQREQRRQGGRGRDPNAEPIPASSAQPMRRDEIAYQRQLAIHSAQNVTQRTFGGQLTTPTPAQAAAQASNTRNTGASREAARSAAQAPVRDTTAAHATIADATPQEQARRAQHAAVIERATRMLGNDNLKVAQFRNALSSYRNNGISASGLIDSFFALFTDTASSSLGTLIRDIADLYTDQKKAESIRTAWNDWRAINEDYPSLPGPSGMTGGESVGWAGITASMPSNVTIQPAKTSRVLKLKSSTKQSSRASPANSASGSTWQKQTISKPLLPSRGRDASEAFPDLPASGSSIEATPKIQTLPWVASRSGVASSSNSARASPRPTPPPSRPISRAMGGTGARGATGGDFPSLPPAPKPLSTIFGYGRGMVRRDNGSSTNMNAWAGSAAAAEEAAAVEESQGRKKGNKGKKVLVQWG